MGWYSTLHACISKWRIKRNRASVASEKIFEKMIGRLYKANACSSNLIFLPLIFPPTFMKICMLFVSRFSRTQDASRLLWSGHLCRQEASFWGLTPPIVIETPKPVSETVSCKLLNVCTKFTLLYVKV